MNSGQIYAGTSGYSYPEWKGSFYPEKLPQKGFLEFYAGKFSTVEINNTFYRFPKASLLEGWRDNTTEGFRFVYARLRRDEYGDEELAGGGGPRRLRLPKAR